MSRFLLLNDTKLPSNVHHPAAREFDDTRDDLDMVRAAGGQLLPLPNAPVEAVANLVRTRRHGAGHSGLDLLAMFSAFALAGGVGGGPGGPGEVPAARLIATDAPLTGGGDLSADRTIGLDATFVNTVMGAAAGVAALAPRVTDLEAATENLPEFDPLTEGGILFAGPGGDVIQDNANLFWKNDTNQLGIGTADFVEVDTKLRVAGNARFDGATAAGIDADGAFGSTSIYTAFVVGSLNNGDPWGGDGGNGGLYAIARAGTAGVAPTNKPFTGLCGFDIPTIERALYFGGGGWGAPDATAQYFYTAPTYDETDDAGVLRMSIGPNGQIVAGDAFSDATGVLRLAGPAIGGVAFRQSIAAPSRFAGAVRIGSDADPAAGIGLHVDGVTRLDNYVQYGGTGNFATIGDHRFPYGARTIAAFRNVGNTTDLTLLALDATGGMCLGTPSSFTAVNSVTALKFGVSAAGNAIQFTHAATTTLYMVSGSIQRIWPMHGISGPYAIDGTMPQAMADADQTPAVGVYSRFQIRTTGAITGNKNLTLPTPTNDDAAYRKLIRNECTGAFSIVIKTAVGGSATVTLANGSSCEVWIRPGSAGVTIIGAPWVH